MLVLRRGEKWRAQIKTSFKTVTPRIQTLATSMESKFSHHPLGP